MDISKKVGYIKGLMDGLKLDQDKGEVKVINAIVDVLQDISDDLELTDGNIDFLNDLIDEIDEDLGAVEEEVYGIYGDEFDDSMCDECSKDCDTCFGCCDEPQYFDIICEKCGKEINVDEDTLFSGRIECPFCGEEIIIECDEDDECDCGCCDHSHGDHFDDDLML